MDFKSLMPFSRGGSLSRTDNGDPFTSLRREMDRMFDDFSRGFPLATGSAGGGFLTPKVNVAETDKGLELTAELPGIDSKDIDLDLADGVLTLKAEHSEGREEKDEKKQYHLVERSTGAYLRRFALPLAADEDKVEASFDKGVLKVFVPRATEAEKPHRRIAMSGS